MSRGRPVIFKIGKIWDYNHRPETRPTTALWLQWRLPLGFDKSLKDPNYVSNTKGLMITNYAQLIDTTPDFPAKAGAPGGSAWHTNADGKKVWQMRSQDWMSVNTNVGKPSLIRIRRQRSRF